MEQPMNIEQLLKVIDAQNEALKIIMNKGKNRHAILLIGETGSGKSFIFNWLSGSEFKWKQTSNLLGEVELIPNKNLNQSAQSNSMKSVTFIPNINKLNEDHVIIDFPGFNDTNGKYSQMSIQLMFDEIVTQTSVKIAVVTEQSDENLKARGADISQLIKFAFPAQNAKFESLGFIANNFVEYDFDEGQIISKISEQLKQKSQNEGERNYTQIYQALSKQIIIIRQIGQENQLKQVLSEKAKNEVQKQLTQIKPVQYKPNFKDVGGVVGDFLQKDTKRIITSYEQFLQNESLQCSLMKLKGFIQKLQMRMKDFDELQEQNCESYYNYLQKIIKEFENNKETLNFKNFLKIFKYFFKYRESIPQYQYIFEQIQYLKKMVKNIENESNKTLNQNRAAIEKIELEIELLKLKSEAEINKIQAEKQADLQRFKFETAEREKQQIEFEKRNQLKENSEMMQQFQKKYDETLKEVKTEFSKQLNDDKQTNIEQQKLIEEQNQKILKESEERTKLRENAKKSLQENEAELESLKKKLKIYNDHNGLINGESFSDQNKKQQEFKNKMVDCEKAIETAKKVLFE